MYYSDTKIEPYADFIPEGKRQRAEETALSVETSACFTGHRDLPDDFGYEEIDKTIEELIGRGINCFLDGMAIGFDLLCFERAVEAKKRHPDIWLVACIPCTGQSKYYGAHDKQRYERLLGEADEIVTLCERYHPGCMFLRDRYMVEMSSVCVAFLQKSKGGTYATIMHATQKQREIIYIK